MNTYSFLLAYRIGHDKIKIEFTVDAESEKNANVEAMYKAVKLRQERSGNFGTSGTLKIVGIEDTST